jgi:pyruvate/2-oxoglutarate/acetoin dehydrogenase E1 component
MKTAIRDNDPVFVMENTILYGEKVGGAGGGIPRSPGTWPT